MITKQQALDYHSMGKRGKIEINLTKPCMSQLDLSLAYTPGVAQPCLEIHKNPSDVYQYTAKGNLVAVISKDEMPEGMEIRIGQKIPLKSNRGDKMTATVVEITEDSYILDGNDQMAGKELTFEIELISIERISVSLGGQGQ